VFNSTAVECFPPQREEDLKIELLPGAPTAINCKVYPLNKKETDILQEFLQEEERKGYITQGSSLYMVPVFFIRKKDSDELRPVMDYRKINKWTKQDHNPLPNIQMALENLLLRSWLCAIIFYLFFLSPSCHLTPIIPQSLVLQSTPIFAPLLNATTITHSPTNHHCRPTTTISTTHA